MPGDLFGYECDALNRQRDLRRSFLFGTQIFCGKKKKVRFGSGMGAVGAPDGRSGTSGVKTEGSGGLTMGGIGAIIKKQL